MPDKPDFPQSPLAQILDWLGILLLAALWICTFYIIAQSPGTVPTHFNGAGQADKFGSPSTLWIFPAIGSFIYLLITLIGRHPQSFNYLKPITRENAAAQYGAAVLLLKCLKASLLLLFIIIQWATYFTAKGSISGLGWWFIPSLVVLVFLPILYYLYISLRKS
jgi:hypothetical protein